MRNRFTERRSGLRSRQIGDMLLESMVAMAVVGIIASGPAYIMSRATVSHGQSNAHAQAATQLRNLLQEHGNDLCTTAPAPITVNGVSLTVTVTCAPLSADTIKVGGEVVVLSTAVANSVVLSVESAIFGGNQKIVIGSKT